MNPRIIFAIAKKDVIDVLKNKNTLMALATPLIMAVFFVFLANVLNSNTDISGTVRLYEPDSSGVATAIKNYFGDALTITQAQSAAEVRDAVARKDSIFGVVVPAGYAEAVKAGQQPQVAVYYDASKSNAEAAQRISIGIQNYAMTLAGIKLPTTVQIEQLNQKQAGADFDAFSTNNFYSFFALVTAVISAGLYIVPNLLVEEKEKKTLRSLIVSPATFGEIITAKLLVGLLYTAIVSVVVALINLPPAKTLGMLALAVLAAALFFNLIGLFIGSVSEQMTTANAYIGVVFFLAFFPIMLVMLPFLDTNEGALGVILHLLPAYYFGDLFQMTMQKSPDMGQFGVTLLICMALIAALAALSTWSLRRQRV